MAPDAARTNDTSTVRTIHKSHFTDIAHQTDTIHTYGCTGARLERDETHIRHLTPHRILRCAGRLGAGGGRRCGSRHPTRAPQTGFYLSNQIHAAARRHRRGRGASTSIRRRRLRFLVVRLSPALLASPPPLLLLPAGAVDLEDDVPSVHGIAE